jgi:DNA-binding XRE family transcriptional regulator
VDEKKPESGAISDLTQRSENTLLVACSTKTPARNILRVKTDIRVKFGRQLQRLRREHGFTQEELARKAGIHPRYLQNLEGSRPNAVTIVTQEKLAKAFGISFGMLMDL